MAPSPRPEPTKGFVDRHVGPNDADVEAMLAVVGHGSLDSLVAAALPASIQELGPLDVPPAAEHESRAPIVRITPPRRNQRPPHTALPSSSPADEVVTAP